ncbi:Com family DNA-binding transcriptional regulator [Pseudomonas sp. 58(2021)]
MTTCCRKLAAATGFTELHIKCPRCRTLNHLKAPEPPPSVPRASRTTSS